MSPPAEQLIRDYLNRLSVAARGQLGPDDRRALVNRTRDFIERKTGLAGPPTAIEVARLLAGLGDPSRLVQQERRRLSAVRGEMPEPAAGRNPITRVLRRAHGKPRSASWHWPVLEGSRADLQITLLDDGGAADVQAGRPPPQPGVPQPGPPESGVPQSGAPQSGAPQSASSGAARPASALHNGSNGTASNGVARDDRPAAGDDPPADLPVPSGPVPSGPVPSGPGPSGPVPSGPAGSGSSAHAPAKSGRPDWFFRALGGEPEEAGEPAEPLTASDDDELAASRRSRPPWPLAGAGGANSTTRELAEVGATEQGGSVPTAAGPAWRLTMPPLPALPKQIRRALSGVAAWYRRRPLEASAVVLLGLGGAIYPPVWLLGAVAALASRLWDLRDKWLGLALPVLATVIAVAVGVTSGGRLSMAHAVHEGWVYGVVASRIAAVLSASYLAWRSVHGRRPPAVPPWNRPYKVG